MTSISQLPAEEIHRLMTTPNAMRLEDIPLVHLRAAELLKDAARYAWLREHFADWVKEDVCIRLDYKMSGFDAAIDAAMQDRS